MTSTGYYLDGFHSGQPDPLRLYCARHCDRAAHLYNLITGGDVHPMSCWAGDDHFCYCQICGELLETGGLTKYGVNDALEYGPEGLSVDELRMVYHSIWPRTDPRVQEVRAELERRPADPEGE